MRIHELLLDKSNVFDAGGETVGRLVEGSGREQLWDARKSGVVDTVVIHYMSAIEVLPERPYDLGRLLRIFCDYGVSSHFLISRRGAVYRLVPQEMKAWHCGGSVMPDGRTGVNDFSIGIELMATESSGFTGLQYRSLCALCDRLEQSHRCIFTYVGHETVAGPDAVARGLRHDVKRDPGPLFDWERFLRCLREHRDHRTDSAGSR